MLPRPFDVSNGIPFVRLDLPTLKEPPRPVASIRANGRVYLTSAAYGGTLAPTSNTPSPHAREGSPQPPSPHARPLHRYECLTAARRADLVRLYSGRELAGEQPRDARGELVDIRADSLPDGWNAARPCPFLGCQYHLAIEYNRRKGTVKPMLAATEEALPGVLAEIESALSAHPDPYHPPLHLHTCALDFADATRELGEATLDDVGKPVRRTRERIRQVVEKALAQIRPALLAVRNDEDEDRFATGDERKEALRTREDVALSTGQAVPFFSVARGVVSLPCEDCGRPYRVRLTALKKTAEALCRSCDENGDE